MTEINKTDQILNNHDFRDLEIVRLAALGVSKSQISRELNVGRTVVTMVLNGDWGQRKLKEHLDSVEQALNVMMPDLVTTSLQQVRQVLKGDFGVERSRVIIDAAKLVLNTSAKFTELHQKQIKDVQQV